MKLNPISIRLQATTDWFPFPNCASFRKSRWSVNHPNSRAKRTTGQGAEEIVSHRNQLPVAMNYCCFVFIVVLSLLLNEQPDAFFKYAGMLSHIVLTMSGREKRHIVKWCHQNAPVQRCQVHVFIQVVVHGRFCFSTI